MRRKFISKKPEFNTLWKEATKLSNQLFRETAELDDAAYQILSAGLISDATLKEFQSAKNKASAKYEEAMNAWRNANIKIEKALHPQK